MKITEALSAEHQVFQSTFDHIEDELPKLKTLAEVKSVASLMEGMLRAHTETEDELFIGPLEHCFEQIGQRETFHQEHEQIEGALRLLQKASRLKQARDLLLKAIAASRRHLDKEERIVFPMAERVLKSKTLAALGQSWMERRSRFSR
jgi:hemerythrin-like domain-containing protein